MSDRIPVPRMDTGAVLRRYGLHARKRLGQCFLDDPEVLERITLRAAIQPEDHVLEIGAGLGSLTRHLARRARRVVAVEIDDRLLPPLRSALAGYDNVSIVHGDILSMPPAGIIPQPEYLVVANIPYYITSAVVRHLLGASPRPRRIVLTVQADVAKRICAGPGDASLLALSVQVYGQPSLGERIPAAAFHPTPSVDSAILSVDVFSEPRIAAELLPTFFRLIKAGFGQKRKTLRNALAAGLHAPAPDMEAWLLANSIDPKRRAETLSIEEWQSLCEAEPPGQQSRAAANQG